ncbi:copper chaperone PCu(A)C [Halomonas sp. WWR20]
MPHVLPRVIAQCIAATLLLTIVASAPQAHEPPLQDLRFARPFATPTPPGAPNGAAYVDITVTGETPARLIGASSPVASRVEVHDMQVKSGMMRMRHVERLEIASGEALKMRPGSGYHLMLLGLDHSLQEGEHFPLTLEFDQRGSIELEVWVRQANEGVSAAEGHHH